MINEISLVSEHGQYTTLKLNTTKKPYVVEDILKITGRVYDDLTYEIHLSSEKVIKDLAVYVNGERAEATYQNGIIRFWGGWEQLFRGIIGFVQLSLNVFYDGDTEDEWFFSEYASVLVKTTKSAKNIDSMLKYVYENQKDILQNETKITGLGKEEANSYTDFWSQIILLEDIVQVYENSFGYFMANCRYKLEKEEVLDKTDKLQFVDAKTIQYIIQHPEYLKQDVTGIKYGRQSFLPTKTLMLQNRVTEDIYENQVVVGFLELICGEVELLATKIQKYISVVSLESETEEGYFVSSNILYMNAKDVLYEFLERMSVLKNKFQQLLTSYRRVLDVKHIQIVNRPEPTAIFRNVPQYNRIYLCIMRWFGKKGYDLVNERVMLNFFNCPAVYEAYVLIKLVNQIKSMGYSLIESRKINYPKRGNWQFQAKPYFNCFVFDGDGCEMTLYYEPVIYDEDKTSVGGIELYRNTSVSLRGETDEERRGRYYVPDYVIKFSRDGANSYLVCDAKYSNISQVKYRLTPELIFKYITSLSPISSNVELKGLFVFYGLTDNVSETESFFDRQMQASPVKTPAVEMVPLSEDVAYSGQEKIINKVLKTVISGRNAKTIL